MTTTDPTCCNTKVTVSLCHPFLVTSRYFYVGLVRPRVFWQTCQHALDTLILCFSSFCYVSSTSPIIIVKRAVVWWPCREENWPCTRFIRKEALFEQLIARIPLVWRCGMLTCGLGLRCYVRTVGHGHGRLLRAFCTSAFASTTPAFVECPPTSCAPISNSNLNKPSSDVKVKVGLVYRLTGRII